jgi:hypothetical protein
MSNEGIHSAGAPDMVDVRMPVAMNEFIRMLGMVFFTPENGRYELRHDRDWWVRTFESAFAGQDLEPDLAYDYLVSVVSEWNDSLADEGTPTPAP